ncbi:tellurite resistance TerB family protein [Kribbella sp. NPDC055071]
MPADRGPRSSGPALQPSPLAVHQLTRHAQWFGPGAGTTVAGMSIQGGMLYVGRGLTASPGQSEPALIDPSLKVNHRRPDFAGATMDYWPSYDDISPEARAAYLAWLAGGRLAPDACIGYVFLFFYGLERRVLVDLAANPALSWELPLLRAEVQRLLAIYGDNRSFSSYAAEFLGVLDLLLAEHTPQEAVLPPLTREYRWQPPPSLVAQLGKFATDGRPLPADWAVAWAWYHPNVTLRAPAQRCLDEFVTLFKSRYATAHGSGLVLRSGRATMNIEYFAASAGLRSVSVRTGLPNVFEQAAPGRVLAAIADGVMNDLDGYSRYLGRNPDGRGTLEAAALLPRELLGNPTGQLAELRDWATHLAATQQAITGADLMRRWPTKSPERMAKAEAVALAQLLGNFELAVEPDARLGGPAIAPGTPVVLFRSGNNLPQAATAAYAAATTLLHLATAVSAADGDVSSEEQTHLVTHLNSALQLTPGERDRLGAHLRWLAVSQVKLTGLKRRIEALSRPQREAVADLLISVAAADGVISPDEITSLTKIFRLLELDPGQVHTRLHVLLSGSAAGPAPSTGPVTVRPAGVPDPGYAIPEPRDASPNSVVLDLASIEAKFAETAEVSALLTDIFSDEETTDTRISAEPKHAKRASPPLNPNQEGIAGLDGNHSALLRKLAERDRWTRAEFEEVAAEYAVMPDGALDTINEASLDATDEPFLEDDGDDTFSINHEARQELFA